ncbi:MAG TPA: agmatinase [Ktedonobacterales bacterium]
MSFAALEGALQPGSVAVIGAPLDENSSFLRGPALAPRRIRDVLHAGSSNWCTEDGIDLSARSDWRDLGDLTLPAGEKALRTIEQTVARLLRRGRRVLTLGGDHSITYALVRAYAAAYPGLTVLHIDAHPDLYDDFEGHRFSHASPFARIMEEGAVKRLVQVGIRAMNPHQQAQARRFGVEVIAMRDYHPGLTLDLDGPLYISLDLDALDPAFAPGVSHHEPGGFSVRELLALLRRVKAPLVGADIVEYNPVRDHADMTAMVAAKFYKELVGRLLRSNEGM